MFSVFSQLQFLVGDLLFSLIFLKDIPYSALPLLPSKSQKNNNINNPCLDPREMTRVRKAVVSSPLPILEDTCGILVLKLYKG